MILPRVHVLLMRLLMELNYLSTTWIHTYLSLLLLLKLPLESGKNDFLFSLASCHGSHRQDLIESQLAKKSGKYSFAGFLPLRYRREWKRKKSWETTHSSTYFLLSFLFLIIWFIFLKLLYRYWASEGKEEDITWWLFLTEGKEN